MTGLIIINPDWESNQEFIRLEPLENEDEDVNRLVLLAARRTAGLDD